MMLRPVELNTSRDPGTGKTYKRRFYHMIVIYEMTLPNLVVSHLDPTSELGQYHDFDIFVLYIDCFIFLVCLLI